MRWFKFDGKWFERNSLALLVSLSIVSMAFVLGPIPDFFLLNHEKMQCASMSEGDEFSSYAPSQPWEIAKPDSAGFLQTKYGSCNYYEVINSKDCCQKLGYTYIGWIEGEKKDFTLYNRFCFVYDWISFCNGISYLLLASFFI